MKLGGILAASETLRHLWPEDSKIDYEGPSDAHPWVIPIERLQDREAQLRPDGSLSQASPITSRVG